jgi:hypothetical protein
MTTPCRHNLADSQSHTIGHLTPLEAVRNLAAEEAARHSPAQEDADKGGHSSDGTRSLRRGKSVPAGPVATGGKIS